MSDRVAVVGAGLSGLCCAGVLHQAGREVALFDRSDAPGGRVRTDEVDGFTLDRGFQVLLTAYPAVKAHLDLEALQLREFVPGASVHWQGKFHRLADPVRHPALALESAASPLFSMSDKLRAAKLRVDVGSLGIDEIFALPDMTLRHFLTEKGFSEEFLANFIRPFFGGIFLERQMETSARMFAFVFKMLAEGSTAVPAKGMEAIPRQLAACLPPERIRSSTGVESLLSATDGVRGVRLTSGEEWEAGATVVATEAETAARLIGIPLPLEYRASTCLYYEIPEPLSSDRLLMLFTEEDALVNNACMLSNVAPEYAPDGRFLLSATVLGLPELSDADLDIRVRADLGSRFPSANSALWRLLRIYRVPWSQIAQPEGIWSRLPSTRTSTRGLYLAGELTRSSSIEGALDAGARAAAAVLAQ